jgi:hypothetical protein
VTIALKTSAISRALHKDEIQLCKGTPKFSVKISACFFCEMVRRSLAGADVAKSVYAEIIL